MRAVVLEQYGGPEVLRIREVPNPVPGPDEVLVDVAATSLNRADVLQRMGKYPPPGPKPEFEIPGLDFAGTAPDGRRVMGLLAGGGYAEKVAVHREMLLPIPDGMSFEEAACIPEAFFTAWDALTDKGDLRPGETVLIHAAGSGVGTAAVQLARLLGAGRIVGTTRTPDKAPRIAALGADRVIVAGTEPFAETADVILDFIGAAYLERNIEAAAVGGRIVLLATQGGVKGEIFLAPLLLKRLRLVGTTLRSRPLDEKIALTRAFARDVLAHFATGRLRVVLDRTCRLDGISEAHRHMESNRSFGKIAVAVRE